MDAKHNIITDEKSLQLPDWLLTDDAYIPLKDHDGFLRKTLLEIMGKLAVLQNEVRENENISVPGHLFSALLLAALIVASKNLNFPSLVLMGFIFYLAFKSGKFIIEILKPCFIAALFTFLIVLPSVLIGNKGILFLPVKVFVTVLVFAYLTRVIPVGRLIGSLGYFKIPAIIVMILALTVNYIVLLGNTATALLEAIKLRSVGKDRKKYNSLAGVVGITFLKSQNYAEETYQAMICRGFTGEYKRKYTWRFSRQSLYYLLFWSICILVFSLC